MSRPSRSTCCVQGNECGYRNKKAIVSTQSSYSSGGARQDGQFIQYHDDSSRNTSMGQWQYEGWLVSGEAWGCAGEVGKRWFLGGKDPGGELWECIGPRLTEEERGYPSSTSLLPSQGPFTFLIPLEECCLSSNLKKRTSFFLSFFFKFPNHCRLIFGNIWWNKLPENVEITKHTQIHAHWSRAQMLQQRWITMKVSVVVMVAR